MFSQRRSDCCKSLFRNYCDRTMPIFLTLGVVVLALICFIGEWLPVDITAISVTVVLMLLGLVTPEQGISGFGNSATITVMAMFILSAWIAPVRAIQVVSDLLLKWGGKNPTQRILAMGQSLLQSERSSTTLLWLLSFCPSSSIGVRSRESLSLSY